MRGQGAAADNCVIRHRARVGKRFASGFFLNGSEQKLSHGSTLIRLEYDMNTLTLSETKPQSRLTNPSAGAGIYRAMRTLQDAANRSTIDPLLLDLVKLRASQINGCAFCIDMHVRDAEKKGEKAHRLYLLNAWQEVDVYSARERAALRWTEALTHLAGSSGVSDAVFEQVRAEFSEAELLELTLTIIAINGWNRLNVGFRVPPTLE